LNLDDSSSLIVAGGEIVGIGIYDDATAVLRGGQIQYLYSYQYVGWGNNYVPHIEIVCDVDSVNYNTTTNVLTGNWLDGSSFNIQLRDQTGYDPAIENIFFTPEPVTLLLFGFGGLVVRSFGKRKSLK